MSEPTTNLPKDQKILVLDASCPRIFVGVWKNGNWLGVSTLETPALEGLFQIVEECLEAAGLKISEIDGFAHDEGPGSVLGIRISAMAIRTWKALPVFKDKPVFTFQSLPFAVEQVRREHELESTFYIISDYRKDTWLSLRSDQAEVQPMHEDEADALDIPVFHSAQRRSWRPPPEAAKPIKIDLAAHPQIFEKGNLIRSVDQPGLYAPFRTDYKRWTPGRHRADNSKH